MTSIKIAGIGGSLRKDSFNTKLIHQAKELMPHNSVLEIVSVGNLPLYNQDDDENPSKEVIAFKDSLRSSHGVLIVSPEYNYSLPGFLKNAVDIASRPPADNVLRGKPVAIMSASSGAFGGMRAQYHWRQVFHFLDMKQIGRPEVFVNHAQEKFDQSGRLKDESTITLIRDLLNHLVNAAIEYSHIQ
jgi:chromate reductase